MVTVSESVLDASAILAFLFNERGSDVVRPWLRGGFISAVNAGEVLSKTFKNGDAIEVAVKLFRSLDLRVVAFDFEQAIVAASFRPYARAANLSFADRACLALGLSRNLPIITAERGWTTPDFGLDIRVIRE